ncbi:MAG: type II toxin-antitoxin system VapC family toxin [Planctomycetia bacterium]|nr:type II toxin-antitoxin system VapC family toxin [Planctomycetia bacterium]
MSVYVVDSSVAIKWFTQEINTAEAVRLQGCGVPLHAPDFLDVELAAIVWKKIRREGLPRADGDFILSLLSTLNITRHVTLPLVPTAFDLADRSGRTVYDCLYLALAVQLGGIMVTADDRLFNALADTYWAGSIVSLQNVP